MGAHYVPHGCSTRFPHRKKKFLFASAHEALRRRPILSTRAFGATVYVIFLLTALFDYVGSLQVRVDDAIRQSTNVFVWGY
jgi:hypothetical protein